MTATKPISGVLNIAAHKLTEDQIAQAINLAGANKGDLGYVGAVLVALATNLNSVTISDSANMLKPPKPADKLLGRGR